MKTFYLLLALVPLTLASIRDPQCQCPQVKCPGEQPAQCECINNAEIACAKRCGGEPILQECPKAAVNPICGGQLIIQCPDPNQTCVPDPFREICQFITDCTGICAGPEFCGGFANIQCPEGKVCLDNPTADCDPANGGADCGGLCAIDQPFIPAPRPTGPAK